MADIGVKAIGRVDPALSTALVRRAGGDELPSIRVKPDAFTKQGTDDAFPLACPREEDLPGAAGTGAKAPGNASRPPAGPARADNAPRVLYMERQDFDNVVGAMPKVELHTHLEGAVRAETILDLAKQHQVVLPADTVDELKRKIGMGAGEDLLDFLKKFDSFRFVFDREETLSRIAFEAIEDNVRDNVLYTELRVNPKKNTDKVSIGAFIDSVLDGMDRATKQYGVQAGLIVSLNRSYDVGSAMEVAREAVKRKDRGVVGMDLAGDEIHHAPEKFKEVFAYARRNGLHVTIHAGEAMGPGSIEKAIETCGAERIGHGVRLEEDPSVMDMVRRMGIPLEMCPDSNLQLNVVAYMRDYPLARYDAAGIAVTINTDDRSIFDVNLSRQYTNVASASGMDLQDMERIVMNGVQSSFLPRRKKAALRARMTGYLKGYNDMVRVICRPPLGVAAGSALRSAPAAGRAETM